MKKIINKYTVAVTILLVSIGLVAAGTASSEYFEMSKNIEIFTDLYKELNTYYVDELQPAEIMKNGIDNMLSSLDPYTNYITEAEIEDYRFQTTGKYGGIGAMIGKMGDYVVITEPYQNYPAAKAGLKVGDKLLSIDGKSVKGLNTEEVSKLLKGQPNSTLKAVVLRLGDNGKETEKEIDIVREEIHINNVSYFGMVTDDIGYIHLEHFTQNAGKEVADALKELEKDHTLKAVVLDLRGNPGGLLNEAVNVSNVFIPRGVEIVSTKGKVEEWQRSFKSLNNAVDEKIPLAVLTNSGSASASEIVSGAIQDLDRGVIVGQKTYGKGLVQTTRDLPYNTKLKVTTAKYYIPSGRCIQAINYAEKDEDGAVSKIPDSLKVAFKTKDGRTVYDGGGVDPDVKVEVEYLSKISTSLLLKNLIFDYATQYCAGKDQIAAAKDFHLSDADYDNFVSFLKDKDYDYTTKSEEVLKELKEAVEKEDYKTAVNDELQVLEEEMKKEKKNDLYKDKDEIKMLIEQEIVKRYYYQDGMVEASFQHDNELKKAIEILNSSDKYNTLLKP